MAYNVPGFLRVSRVVKEFRPDFIYDRYVSYSYAPMVVGRRFGIPVVLEVNSPYSYQKQTFDEKIYFKKLLSVCEKCICRDASHIITVSSPLKKFLVNVGVPAVQITVMPNGVDSEVFHPSIDGLEVKRRFGIENKIVIGFTGILRPWHGLDLLLDAFHRISSAREDLHLLIVGDGPIRGDLENVVADRGLSSKVTITGRQPYDKVRLFVAAMDIAVSPRSTFYASPMKIIEYMAMGKGLIAPDTQNIRDIVAPEEDGILFVPLDSDDLAKKMHILVDNTHLRKTLGINARRKIETRYTWLGNADAVIRLMQGKLANRCNNSMTPHRL
jgi:glycosyltransferase involved in cell wall biosynthesis